MKHLEKVISNHILSLVSDKIKDFKNAEVISFSFFENGKKFQIRYQKNGNYKELRGNVTSSLKGRICISYLKDEYVDLSN